LVSTKVKADIVIVGATGAGLAPAAGAAEAGVRAPSTGTTAAATGVIAGQQAAAYLA
jgi:hypothetical protein